MKNNKKTIIAILIIIILIVGIFLIINLLKNSSVADKVIYGNIYTGVDGEVFSEAVAIINDEIVFVGNKADVKKYINKNTKVFEYDDGIVLSGFTDTHTHVTPYVGTNEYQFDITNATSVSEYVKIIEDYIKNNPNKEMIIGRGFNNTIFENNIPTKEILDQINVDKPIYIKSSDGHSCWVNSKMLDLIGVTKDTENPIGGTIVKDENKEPTGYLKDSAMDVLAKPFLVPYSVEEYKVIIKKAQEYYASMGYSSYIEVFVEADSLNYNLYKAYEELDKSGELILRVQGAWNINNNEDSIQNLNKVIKYKEESKGGMFELTDVKIFMDGVAETETAYLSEPYADNPTNYGADRWPSEADFNKLVDMAILANKNDMVIHFHAIGDAAITKAIDVIEKARKTYINPNIHNVITHFEIVKDSDIKRLKENDIIVSANLSWGCKMEDSYESVEVKTLGEERAFKAYPYKSAMDIGAIVSMATDYPAGPVVSPIAAYIVAVTRNITSDESNVRDASQKMTVTEALKTLTYNGAYQMRQENIRGTIEVGKKADIIVLNKNLLISHSFDTLNTDVLLNIVDGKIVYSK
ncbi:MAG: amidohydrolase [bacterium]|nr:amidohydrolase [bacterium]